MGKEADGETSRGPGGGRSASPRWPQEPHRVGALSVDKEPQEKGKAEPGERR